MEDSSANEWNGDQAQAAPEQEADDASFALYALGELHDQELQASPEQAAEHAPAAAEDAQAPSSLQTALDSYKDWLSSID